MQLRVCAASLATLYRLCSSSKILSVTIITRKKVHNLLLIYYVQYILLLIVIIFRKVD